MLVPVDLLVRSVCLNADMPPERVAPYMALRLRSLLTTQDIGVARTVGPLREPSRCLRVPAPRRAQLRARDSDPNDKQHKHESHGRLTRPLNAF